MKYFIASCLLCSASFFGSASVVAAPQNFIQLQLEEREERVEELGDEIMRLDKKIEHKLDRLEKRFIDVRDSRDSLITVQKAKEDLINKLGELAEYYAQQRELMLKESRRDMPRANPETLDRIAEAYDKHIDARIEQITRLSQSLASPNAESDRGRDKQIARRTREQRNATQEALRGIIDRLEKENDELRLRKKSMGEHDAEMMEQVIQQNEELIEKRTLQLEALEDAPQKNTKPVSKSEALELRKLLEASAQDIKEDSYRISNLVIEYAKEEEAVRRLTEQLQASKASEESR